MIKLSEEWFIDNRDIGTSGLEICLRCRGCVPLDEYSCSCTGRCDTCNKPVPPEIMNKYRFIAQR